jgi:uncharacterized protein YciI
MQSIPAERTLFVLLITYIKPLDEIDRLLTPHKNYLDRHYTSGHFLTSGRQEPRTGGVILAQAENKAQIQAITEEDPFLTERVAEYHIVEFHPSRYNIPAFEQLFSKTI